MNSSILKISSSNLRLDISSLSATNKKPWCESTGDFSLWPEPSKLGRGTEIKRPDRRRRRMQGFFFVKHSPEDHATAGSVILHEIHLIPSLHSVQGFPFSQGRSGLLHVTASVLSLNNLTIST